MSNRIERAAIEMIRSAIGPAAEIVADPSGLPDSGARADIEIRAADGHRFMLDLKPWGRPSAGPVTDAPVVWVLERSAVELRDRLRAADANFVDLSGVVRLHLPGIIVDRTDLPAAVSSPSAETRNPFADRASLIPRTLFDAPPGHAWSVQDLSSAAGVSLGTTSYVVKALAERELVEVTRVGREKRVRLGDRRALLLQWTAEYNWRRNTAVAFEAAVGSPSRFLRRLPALLDGLQWAVALQAGASLVLPHARWDTVHAYVAGFSPDGLREVGYARGWKPSQTGKVVLLEPHYAASVWHGIRDVEGIPVVSELQLILDLWHYPVRGREQAELLLDEYAPASP
ncbi:MAG TPA: type IV toxin-antitoxin system AbiEi family antitoxin, partial [Longimicrobiales bacterium]|nr:type IV toxin-antitoxin system AbiEi family antitoxin [Longimicrobiales bacterium]